jgi:anti-sigma B factor antagonist
MQRPIVSVVTARGDLDFRETREIAQVIGALAELGQNKIVLDWSETDFINPLAIGILIDRRHTLINQQGELKFSRMNSFVRGIFWKYGLDDLFENYSSLEDAIVSFDEEWSSENGNSH